MKSCFVLLKSFEILESAQSLKKFFIEFKDLEIVLEIEDGTQYGNKYKG